jgi:hypothetical protein
MVLAIAISPYDQRLPIENFCSINRDRRGESRRGDSHRYDAVSSRRLTHERALTRAARCRPQRSGVALTPSP